MERYVSRKFLAPDTECVLLYKLINAQLTFLAFYRITLHMKGENYCEVIKKCVPPEGANITTKTNTTATTNVMTDHTNATIDKVTMVEQNMTEEQAFNVTTTPPDSNTTDSTEQDEPSIIPTTSQPTKSTEEPSTDIIDILIGNKRRRKRQQKRARGRSKRVSQVSPIPTHTPQAR